MTMALHALERNQGRYPKMAPEDLNALTAREANAAFGELNYRLMGRNPTFQDLLRLTLLAPDFLEARSRRTTWSLAPAGEDGRHSVVLTHRKRNNYGSLGKFLIDVHWDEDLPVKVIERGYTSALAGRIAVELTAGPMTVTELVVNLNDTLDDGAEKVRPNSVGKACRRGTKETPRRFTVTGKGPTARYSNA